MPRTTIALQTPVGPYPALQPAADSLDMALTAADVANGNQCTLSGPVLLIVQNSGGAPFTFTLTSIADALKRTGDITTYSMAAGDVSMFWIPNVVGWRQADGFLYFAGSNAAIKFACLSGLN